MIKVVLINCNYNGNECEVVFNWLSCWYKVGKLMVVVVNLWDNWLICVIFLRLIVCWLIVVICVVLCFWIDIMIFVIVM